MKNIMILMITILFMAGCNDYLDLQPTDKITPETVFSSETGIEAFLANLYRNMPIEDFNCGPLVPNNCLNINGVNNNNNVGQYEFGITDDGMHSAQNQIGGEGGIYSWWVPGYQFNKDVNLFFSYLPGIKSISEETRRLLYGEAYFMRAYTYYALAKRYGGVPIITSIAEVSDSLALFVPRSTEKETWDFALAACDSAAMFLGNGDGKGRRATKWAALALKSRIALHAASIARYWDKAPLSGAAVDAKLVGGMTDNDALHYYDLCIEAAGQIIDNGPFKLYKPLPANPDEAAENYRHIFEFPNDALEEVILLKGFDRVGIDYGSNQDNFGNPNQTRGAWTMPGRLNPTLDMIDTYERYSNPGVYPAPIVTTTDGKTDNYNGYNPSSTYLTFDDPLDIFKGKDARLFATVILPGSMWKGVKIVIQGGLIDPSGNTIFEDAGKFTMDGVTYYAHGGDIPTSYSAFDTRYPGDMSRTGFIMRKFLSTSYIPELAWHRSTTDYIDIRYAEVLLNYAEAVAESGHGDAAKAVKAINDIRKRAAFTADIPLTLNNVLHERRVELVYENKRHWDLIRKREYHKIFDNTQKTALFPIFDLRTMKYIFVRRYVYFRAAPMTFVPKAYYRDIPGVATNKLIQNPQY